jgi:transposase
MALKRRRRRIWEDDEMRRVVAQTLVPGVSVSRGARRYGVNANLVFKWLCDPRFQAPVL